MCLGWGWGRFPRYARRTKLRLSNVSTFLREMPVPWFFAILAGRVNLDPKTGLGSYTSKPKFTAPVSKWKQLVATGVNVKTSIPFGGKLMIITRYVLPARGGGWGTPARNGRCEHATLQCHRFLVVSSDDGTRCKRTSLPCRSVSYLLIQGPAFAYDCGRKSECFNQGKQHWWAFAGLMTCLAGFVGYLVYQVGRVCPRHARTHEPCG